MDALTLSHRQIVALYRTISLTRRVGGCISVTNEDALTEDEMLDLERRFADYLVPLSPALHLIREL